MCFVSLTYLCLCWSEFFDNIAFHTVRVLHMRSYVVSLSAEWLSELAGQKGFMWRVCVISDSRGEALAQDSWSESQRRTTELRSWARQESKIGRRRVYTHGVPCHRNEHTALAALARCLNFLDYLWEEKENTSDRIWIYHLCLTWKLGCLQTLVSHSCSPPTWFRVAKGNCC